MIWQTEVLMFINRKLANMQVCYFIQNILTRHLHFLRKWLTVKYESKVTDLSNYVFNLFAIENPVIRSTKVLTLYTQVDTHQLTLPLLLKITTCQTRQ